MAAALCAAVTGGAADQHPGGQGRDERSSDAIWSRPDTRDMGIPRPGPTDPFGPSLAQDTPQTPAATPGGHRGN